MVGSAILRVLTGKGHQVLIASRNEVDLTNQSDVRQFFNQHKIDQVYLAAAKVGGIQANENYPANFVYENLMIQNNVIHESFLNGVKKLFFSRFFMYLSKIGIPTYEGRCFIDWIFRANK